MKIVLVTGGFDPLHSGHIKYFEAARRLGDKLIVGVNSDAWLTRKKGRPFLPNTERVTMISNLKMVDHCILFNDDDGSAIEAIKNVKLLYPGHEIIFANGGDRTKNNIPEMVFNDVEFVFGVGGENKLNSSSWILDNWRTQRTERPWGYWRVLDEQTGFKVKELVIDPGKKLSMQRHFYRAEHWYIAKGRCDILTELEGIQNKVNKLQNETYLIGNKVWHQGQNNYDEPCHIIEVQFGEKCIEEDIERK